MGFELAINTETKKYVKDKLRRSLSDTVLVRLVRSLDIVFLERAIRTQLTCQQQVAKLAQHGGDEVFECLATPTWLHLRLI